MIGPEIGILAFIAFGWILFFVSNNVMRKLKERNLVRTWKNNFKEGGRK